MSDTEIIDKFKGLSRDQLQNYLNFFLNPQAVNTIQPAGVVPVGTPFPPPVLMQPPK